MTRLAPPIAYQATDLVRSHRQVLDAARHGGALVRDKDGMALLIAPADELGHDKWVGDAALDLVRIALALNEADSSPARFGDMAWVSVLPAESQRQFFTEMAEGLIVAAGGRSLRNIELLLGDWKATAESWADPDVREQLLSGSDEPLYDVELA